MISLLHRVLRRMGAPLLAVALLVVPMGVSVAQAAGSASGGTASLGTTLQQGVDLAAPPELQGAKRPPSEIVSAVLRAALELLGVVLFGYLLYGGYLYMTAGGDMGQVKTALSVIKNAIIGLVIIALAYTIASFVVGSLGNAVSGTSQASQANGPQP